MTRCTRCMYNRVQRYEQKNRHKERHKNEKNRNYWFREYGNRLSIEAGFSVTGYDLKDEPMKRFISLGGRKAESSKEVRENSETVCVMVLNGTQVKSAVLVDKNISKAPDRNGDLVYAHRPQIIWDSGTNSIINIAYCEGRSRATTAL